MHNDIQFKCLIEKFPDLWERKTIEKKTLLYEENKSITKLYYSEKGRARIYKIHKHNKKEKEVTIGFFFEKEPVIPIVALIKNVVPFVDIETIDDCVMQVITIENWKKIEKQEPLLIKDILFGISIDILQIFYDYQLFNSYNAETRIKEFFKRWPQLKDVKNEYIASLFGNDDIHLYKKRKELGL